MKNRIGIIGGGQLGRMMGFAAKKLGFNVTVIDPTPNSPAGQVVDKQITASYDDERAIRFLARDVDFLTFEIELANASLLDELTKKGLKVNPGAKTLLMIKDKLRQKEFLQNQKLPIAEFVKIENEADVFEAGRVFGYPLLLKARFDAYDGRGNLLIKNENEIKEAMGKLKGRELYVEKFIPFVKELSVVSARGMEGEIVSYEVVETVHKNNICHMVFAPARVNTNCKEKAHALAEKAMRHLSGAGVFAIEMFLTNNGEVLINEIAPRVHNSGHFTIEACVTSQFEQHIRAVTGLPLGSTEMIVPAAVMVNILGERNGKAELKNLDKALSINGINIHIYGKNETRIERKMGHVTAIAKSLDKAYEKALMARQYIDI